MSKNQTIQEFDENFFSSIAVPKVKDYSRLSSSPSRDQPCESSYFEKHFPNLECDTPVKMKLPSAVRESGDALPTGNMDNFLSSSSSSESTVHVVEQNESVETAAPAKPVPHQNREPLKIVPNDTAPVPAKPYGENQLIESLEKLTMFAAKEPEERLSQRRRSEQKKKQEEENKRRSALPAANRARSISTKRSVSREPTAAATRESSIPRSRHNSVTRTISAPITNAATGVVTRAMAARAAEVTFKAPGVRRSVMPMKIAQKTPVAAVKNDAAPGSGDRSRDRTRRTNTTGTSSFRRSVMPMKPTGSTTPIAPPRRSASVTKTTVSLSKMTPKSRPIATANRSSILRMNVVKPTAPPTAAAADSEAQQKRLAAARPAAPVAQTARSRQALRPSSGQRPARPPVVTTRARSVDRAGQQPPTTAGAATPAAKVNRSDLFNRLAIPKLSATPRVSHDGPTSSLRKTAVRPVPSYIYNVNKGYEKKPWIN
ncbi:hypothetical protein GCK72_000780 [Caenorhabditis remanei]|uniref:Uncharacterized protein n=1 Tax=Caenorhabditis remanei TaxID=31234 RepID=A0A6A5HRK8_CAERE|nr:hypothetical protein GCK72_000780 [Caenorhabditis remanei]KAF1768967.1 hypothetical protein GCK72_000780 [Caenorhabditis remanei]